MTKKKLTKLQKQLLNDLMEAQEFMKQPVNLLDCMKLPYEVLIETEFDEGKRVYYAYINELGMHACYGKGYTREEALKSLDEIKVDIISYLLENNKPIPKPSLNTY